MNHVTLKCSIREVLFLENLHLNATSLSLASISLITGDCSKRGKSPEEEVNASAEMQL